MQCDLLTFGLRDFICSHIKACREREMHLQLGLIWSGLATRPKSSAFVLVETTMEVDRKKATEIGNYINGPLRAGCLPFFLSNHLSLKIKFCDTFDISYKVFGSREK